METLEEANYRLLKMIPRYASGQALGRARNARLRDIERLLKNYKFNRMELGLFETEIRDLLRKDRPQEEVPTQ